MRGARSDGSVVYLHGVGASRGRWLPPVERATRGLRVDLIAPSYADILTADGTAESAPSFVSDPKPHIAAVDEPERAAYVLRQRRLSDLVARVGEAGDGAWPTGLPHPGDIADRLPLDAVLRAPLLGLDQVGRYLDDDVRRAAVVERCAAVIARAPRPCVLVAHSLGSLVAWDALARPDVRVDLLVTLGSPLAHTALAPERREVPHGRLGAWLNVVNMLDPVPAGRGLAGAFPGACDAFLAPASTAHPLARVWASVSTLATSHLESTYLQSPTVTAAIRDALLAPVIDAGPAVARMAS
jgi:pimeloyl-ACP methyl ester carboxylesterase